MASIGSSMREFGELNAQRIAEQNAEHSAEQKRLSKTVSLCLRNKMVHQALEYSKGRKFKLSE